MVKTLQKHGNSHALVIEKTLMDALGVTAKTPLQVTISGNTLLVAPAHIGIGRKTVASSVKKLRGRYGTMLRNLAK